MLAVPLNPCRSRLRTRSTLLLAALTCGIAIPAASAASVFSKTPYLQAPGPTSVMLLWESLENLPARVCYRQDRGLDQIQGVPEPRAIIGISTRYRTNAVVGVKTNVTSYTVTNTFYLYEARLDDLQPNTTYQYVVELGPQASRRSHFHTFGESPATVRFVAYGDSRSNPSIHRAIARRFRKFEPDFILHTGDLVARGRDYALWGREFFEPLAGIIDHIPVLPAIGNHEDDGTNYLAYFHLPQPERWYSFDRGPVHMLALDYHFESASHDQFAFAQKDLRSSRAPWKVVFLHVPMMNVGGHASTWGHSAYLPLFHETHVDLVLAGHSHLYERFRPVAPQTQGTPWPITHITTGGGGAGLHAVHDHPALACRESTNHFILLEATATRLKGQAFLASGKTLDSFDLFKDPATHLPIQTVSAYPEEWLRTYSDAAPLLRGRLTALPTNSTPVMVTFALSPLTNAPGPVQLDIVLTPESMAYYESVGAPLHAVVPETGKRSRCYAAEIRSTGRKPITATAGAALSPPLVFQARLRSGELDVIARGTASVFDPPKP
jgi:hypothetical protein